MNPVSSMQINNVVTAVIAALGKRGTVYSPSVFDANWAVTLGLLQTWVAAPDVTAEVLAWALLVSDLSSNYSG